jgi:TRAP-type C4-dicarboxylate transport system substrate-binding protein
MSTAYILRHKPLLLQEEKMKKVSFILFGTVFMLMILGFPSFSQAKPIELTFAHTLPAASPSAKTYDSWAKDIETKSGGRLKITVYGSGSLLREPELFRGVQSGTADMVNYVVGIDS